MVLPKLLNIQRISAFTMWIVEYRLMHEEERSNLCVIVAG